MKKLLFLVSVLVMIVLSAAGCGNTADKTAGNKELQEINIGLMPDIDSVPVIMAQEKGYFAEEGLKVNI